MKDEDKTKKQPINELKELQKLIAKLEASKTDSNCPEEVLRNRNNKYKTLIENLPQKIFYKDKNSVYVSCNNNYARDLKINPDEITGKTDCDFHPIELAEKYRADDKRIMESGNTETIEETYVQD
ncbi:MAG: PAS domain-containing protein, partial [Deltaproteobacteria bacterium]|nr:PAS domain-containing protein [Deltaproteobacteria bacterium]